MDHFCPGGAAGGLQLQPSMQQLPLSEAEAVPAQYSVEEPPSPPHSTPQLPQPLRQLHRSHAGGRCLLEVPPHLCPKIRPIHSAAAVISRLVKLPYTLLLSIKHYHAATITS